MKPARVRLTHTPILGLMCALSLYYAFVVTAGTFGVLGWNSDFYDALAEGFRAGHLYLKTVPAPELLARANPYAYSSDKDWDAWLWDASLYNGHFYIYWGPVPALLLWGIKAALGYAGTIHDQWLVLFFSLMRLYAGSALIMAFARAHNPTLPRWALYLALLVFGLASPTPFFLARPLVYEASIASGQGFLCLGLYLAYCGLQKRRDQTRWFVAAGSCLGCALASRASLIITAPLVVAATAFCAARPYSWRKLLGALCSIGTPVAISLALYALYNQLRFDAFYEFGLKYQLTGRRFETAARFFLPNLASYFGAAISWSCKFPFVRLPEHRQLSSLFSWPSDYDVGDAENGERVGGVLVATTVCWLWSVWIWHAYSWARLKYKSGVARVTLSQRELWLFLCACAVIASAAPASRLYLASMRYMEDAASGMLLGAIAAGFRLLRPSPDPRGAPTRRLLGPLLYGSLGLHTVVVGVCLGFTGYADTFRKENTALFRELERKLSVCDVKETLRKLDLHALPSSERDAIYVAWGDDRHLESRNPCSQRTPARP
jgi:hypothetical protein